MREARSRVKCSPSLAPMKPEERRVMKKMSGARSRGNSPSILRPVYSTSMPLRTSSTTFCSWGRVLAHGIQVGVVANRVGAGTPLSLRSNAFLASLRIPLLAAQRLRYAY
jgi:hypothetical protein